MTIIWKPTTNQIQNGMDETGNHFQINHTLKTITVRTPDGFLGHSWTIKEALDAATSKREEARKSYLPQSVILLTPTLETEEISYWTNRASVLLNHPCKIIGWF